MATYIYNGEQELVFPTLGLIVNKGDQFDGPDGLVIAGVSIATGKKAKPVIDEPVVADEPIETPADA